MADLVLNFAPTPESSTGGVHKKVKTGRWSERAKLNSKSVRNARKTVDRKEDPNSKSSSTSSGNSRNNSNNSREKESESPLKRPRLDRTDEGTTNTANTAHASASSSNGRPLVISSLFSSLPQFESLSSSTKTLRTLAPTNAPSDASFSSLNLDPNLLVHLTASPKLNLKTLTSIQTVAIPHLIQNSSTIGSNIPSDAILQAETGSGKTLSYLLPILDDLIRISKGKSWTRQVGTLAIVLVPTKELAVQVLQVCQDLLSFRGDHRWCIPGMLTGGTTRTHEKARLRSGLPLLISTPGRLIDHLQTTSCFRIAGDPVRSTNASSSSHSQQLPTVEDAEEFDIEDHPFERGKEGAGDSDYDSTDYERLESMPASKSHRSSRSYLDKCATNNNLVNVDQELTLRWLVLDEADRLMDMGFEPQIASILNLLASRSRIAAKAQGRSTSKRRTILCSATVDSKVQSLAGIALNNPIVIKPSSNQTKNAAGHSNEGETTNDPDSFKAPAQLKQSYIITPSKLRFIVLVSILRQALKDSEGGGKVIIFASCTDAVDLLWEAFGGLDLRRDANNADDSSNTQQKKDSNASSNKLCKKCMLFPRTQFYRLHGNMDFQSRIASLGGFSETSEQLASRKKRKRALAGDNDENNNNEEETDEVSDKILICTSVAARGLDIPQVENVIQYDLPTEGGSKEYLHRVGRTARAGRKGQSWAIVLPEEKDWVDWVSKSDDPSSSQIVESVGGKLSRLHSVSLDDTLKDGLGGDLKKDWETRATDVQMAFERWVHLSDKNTVLARNAFKSHVRAYATHPSAEKFIFHIKNLHLGHLAKSFGLREAPGGNKGASSSKKSFSSKNKSANSQQSSVKGHQKGFSSSKVNKGSRRVESSNEFNVASLDMLEKLVRNN